MDLENFKNQCEHFLSISDDLQDGWQIVRPKSALQNDVYMKKRVFESVTGGLGVKNAEENEKSWEMDNLDYDDRSLQNVDNSPETVTWEYHIIFSESYGVPVLYFNCWKNDGSILTFDEILSWSHSDLKPHLVENRWQSLTQQEHPMLSIPFYMLHPCKTAEYLNTIQGDSRINPLVTWLSSFGGAVGLSLPLEYGMIPYIEKDVTSEI